MLHVNVAIREALERRFPQASRFLLGVSGGRDSQVLLNAFAHVAKPLGHHLVAVGVNHGLRDEADSELDLAEALANKVGVPFERVGIKVDKGGNLLARARDGRYQALHSKRIEHGCDALVVAHHRDDLAETVLYRILRNGRIGSFDVMPELTENKVFRPLLQVSREQITKYARNRKIYFADDPSNINNKFDRVWIRNQVIPTLSERFPDIKDKLVSLCHEARSIMEVSGASRVEEV